jgi:hypothetical protein
MESKKDKDKKTSGEQPKNPEIIESKSCTDFCNGCALGCDYRNVRKKRCHII